MDFFEFESEAIESSAPKAAAPAAKPRPAPSSATKPSSTPPARSGSSTPASRGPVTTPSRTPAGGTAPARPTTPAARPTPARPGGTATPARPGGQQQAPTPKPSPTPGATGSPGSPTPTSNRPQFDWSQLSQYVQQGLGVAQLGVQIGQQFAGARTPGAAQPAPAPTAVPLPDPGSQPVPGAQPGVDPDPNALGAAPGTPQPGADQLPQLLQAWQQRQIPPLAGSLAPAGLPASPPGQMDGLATLQTILSNPQFQQTMQSAAMIGGARSVPLPMPVPAQPQSQQPLQIPLAAVLNAIVQLAGRSMVELNAGTREEESVIPEYLVDEHGEYVVDPASAEDRAALVAHLFRVNAAAQTAEAGSDVSEGEPEIDESEVWAEEAGFIL